MKYHQPFLHKSEGRVIKVTEAEPFLLIELDDTIFYPGGGGQPHDKGHIRKEGFEAEIVDVKKEGSIIVHKARPIKGTVSEGDLIEQEHDIFRREQLVRMHTGEHMLFSALQKTIKDISLDKIALDVSESSLFVKADNLTWSELFASEELVNKTILEARKVIVKEVKKEEAALIPGLRIKLDRIKDEKIRIVDIEGYDLAACTGIHALDTSFVGNLLITKFNQTHGSYELRFRVNEKAELFSLARTARELSAVLETDTKQLVPFIKKMKAEDEELKKKVRSLELEKTRETNSEKIGKVNFVYNSFENIERRQLMDQANALLAPDTVIFFINNTTGKKEVILITAPNLAINAIGLLKPVLDQFIGKGGGRDNVAQGSVTSGKDEEIIAAIKEQIKNLRLA